MCNIMQGPYNIKLSVASLHWEAKVGVLGRVQIWKKNCKMPSVSGIYRKRNEEKKQDLVR